MALTLSKPGITIRWKVPKQPTMEWHKKINHATGKAHSTFLTWWSYSKTEQANREVSLVQLAAGGAVRNTRKKYRTKQNRLAKIGEQFERGGTIH